MKRAIGAFLLFAVFELTSCAHPFSKVYPGMTSKQVAETVGAPNRSENFAGGYSAWYYGSDRCLLLHDDEVVSKQETETQEVVKTPVGTYTEKIPADCLPPGLKRRSTERRVSTPYGEVRVPAQSE
jgi:hypothetical protein